MKTIEVPDHLYDAMKEIVDTFTAKGQDYSRSEDAWDSNFRFTSELFGIAPWDSAHFNVAQKLARLAALRHRGRGPLNEPAIDSYRDIAVYAVIAHALLLHHNAIAHPSVIATGPLTGENARIARGGTAP